MKPEAANRATHSLCIDASPASPVIGFLLVDYRLMISTRSACFLSGKLSPVLLTIRGLTET